MDKTATIRVKYRSIDSVNRAKPLKSGRFEKVLSIKKKYHSGDVRLQQN